MEKYDKEKLFTFEQAKNYLFYKLSYSEKHIYGKEKGIERTKEFMNLLGNPQEAIPTIHIAGTSGKGSVAYTLSNIIQSTGHSVGLVVSPHVYDIRERMQVNNAYISKEEFVDQLNELIPFINKMDKSACGRPTYYEINLALAFSIFQKKELDFVVLETGIGGLYDSTNIIERQDKISVITSLGIDHTEILGNTIEEIAAQKAGIINSNSNAVALEPEPAAKLVIQSVAAENNATLNFVKTSSCQYEGANSEGIGFSLLENNNKTHYNLPLFGKYQAENAALAINVLRLLSKRYDFSFSSKELQNGLNNIRIPARTELRTINNRQVIIDSAHNPQKISAFFSMLKEANLPENSVVIFASKKGKNSKEELQEIKKYCNNIVITGFFKDEPAQFIRSESPAILASQALELGFKVLAVSDYPIQAFNSAVSLSRENQPIIITGSMYMIGELNSNLR